MISRRLIARSLLVLAVLAAGVGIVPAAADEYTPGTAVASAQPFGVTVVYNNANIGIGIARANASYASTSAKARAAMFSFGLAELFAGLKICGTAPVPPGAVPPPLSADTNEAPGETVERSDGVNQGAIAGATHVKAAPNASAQGDVTGGGFDLAGIAALTGGEAHAQTTSDPSTQTRTATADTVSNLSLLGGVIKLTGIRFHLEQTATGADSRTGERGHASSFTFGGLEISGLPIPLPGAAEQDLVVLNRVTGALGVQFRMPALVPDGSFGYLLTPFTVVLGGSPVYGDLIASLANNAAFNQVLKAVQSGLFDSATCNQLGGLMQSIPQLNSLYNAIGIAAPILLAVVVSAFTGNGAINIEVGGVRTKIDDTYYPPSAFQRAAPAPVLPPSSPAAETRTPVVAAPPLGLPTAAPVTPAGQPALAAPVATVGATRCATTSPALRPGCGHGNGPLGALAAVGLAGALLAYDELHRRRRAAQQPLETSP